jgi:predicted CoA-binding protein
MDKSLPLTAADQIADFLSHKRFALIGAARSPQDLSHKLLLDLRKHGYEVVPVNPKTGDIAGVECFATVKQINPPLCSAILMTPVEEIEHLVYDCAEAGITQLWIPMGVGKNPLGMAAKQFCEQSGIQVINGFCPYMFLKNAGFFHRLHGFAAKHSRAYHNPV